MELHFPSNWACEGEVDVLYVDGVTGAETSYGTLAQGKSMTRETYPGAGTQRRRALRKPS